MNHSTALLNYPAAPKRATSRQRVSASLTQQAPGSGGQALTSAGCAELAVAVQLLGGGKRWSRWGQDHAGLREVFWTAEEARLGMKEAGQMQNLESAGAGRSVSTQTGSMTGECPGPCCCHPSLSLCPEPLSASNSAVPACPSSPELLPRDVSFPP